MKTWTRMILLKLSDNVGLSLSDASMMIEEIFEFILDELEKGDDVKISSFGTFSVRHKIKWKTQNLRRSSYNRKKCFYFYFFKRFEIIF